MARPRAPAAVTERQHHESVRPAGSPYELYSKLLRGGYIRDYIGECYRVIKGDTRGLDYSSCRIRV